jgi:hypothetical protein
MITLSLRNGPSPFVLRVVVEFAMLFEITSIRKRCEESPVAETFIEEKIPIELTPYIIVVLKPN